MYDTSKLNDRETQAEELNTALDYLVAANEIIKKLLKDHKISEDEERRALDEVQKMTDTHCTLIDDLQKKKDVELLGK